MRDCVSYGWNSRKQKYRAHILVNGNPLCQCNAHSLDSRAAAAPASRRICQNCTAIQSEQQAEAGATLIDEIPQSGGASLAVLAATGEHGPTVLLRRSYSKGGRRHSLPVDPDTLEDVVELMRIAAGAAGSFREVRAAMDRDDRR